MLCQYQLWWPRSLECVNQLFQPYLEDRCLKPGISILKFGLSNFTLDEHQSKKKPSLGQRLVVEINCIHASLSSNVQNCPMSPSHKHSAGNQFHQQRPIHRSSGSKHRASPLAGRCTKNVMLVRSAWTGPQPQPTGTGVHKITNRGVILITIY